MYIMINNIVGKKTIYLSYPIYSFNSRKEIAVVSMFRDNIQYEMTKPLGIKLMDGSGKEVLNKAYTRRELSALVESKLILTDLNNDS